MLIGLYINVPAFQEKLAFLTEENFVDENIYEDIRGVSARLDEEILKGSDSFTIYLKNMDVNEINQINSSIDGVFGSGESYQQVGRIGKDYVKIVITTRKTMNYYAYAAYIKHEPIPVEEKMAKRLYNVVKEIMGSVVKPGMSDYEKELAIHDYLVTHCYYSENADQNPGSEIYRAYGALVNGNAVCNGYAEAYQLLLSCAGVECKFVTGSADGIDHAWNLVQIDGQWYHVDATWDDPKPDLGKECVHPYFNVTDEAMRVSHVWEEDHYPEASSMEYNYYRRNNSYFTDFESYKQIAFREIVHGSSTRFEAAIENYVAKDNDMQFVFENNNRFASVNWQYYDEARYKVLVLKGE